MGAARVRQSLMSIVIASEEVGEGLEEVRNGKVEDWKRGRGARSDG